MRVAAPIDIDLTPPPYGEMRRAPGTRNRWPVVGLVLVAAVAVLIGRAQRGDAGDPGTVVRATGVFQCESGMDTAFQIDVVNQVGASITLSRVEVEAVGAPTMRAAFGPEGERGPCRSGWSWRSAPKRLSIAPDDLGVVFLAYRRVCRPAVGPVFISVLVTVDLADGSRVVRDITPDPESLSEVNANSSVMCNT